MISGVGVKTPKNAIFQAKQWKNLELGGQAAPMPPPCVRACPPWLSRAQGQLSYAG